VFKKPKDGIDSLIGVLLNLDDWELEGKHIVQPAGPYRDRIRLRCEFYLTASGVRKVDMYLDKEIIATSSERSTEIPYKPAVVTLWYDSLKKAENAIHKRKSAKADEFLLETILEEVSIHPK
jgi:hypothetical protein